MKAPKVTSQKRDWNSRDVSLKDSKGLRIENNHMYYLLNVYEKAYFRKKCFMILSPLISVHDIFHNHSYNGILIIKILKFIFRSHYFFSKY